MSTLNFKVNDDPAVFGRSATGGGPDLFDLWECPGWSFSLCAGTVFTKLGGMSSPLENNPKLMSLEQAVSRRAALRASGEKLVLTNGCFDLLHCGHLFYLQEAAKLGDELWVGLNGTDSVRRLKGPTRPVQDDRERAYMLGALPFIRGLFLFHTPRLDAEIRALQPDVYAKAGDYTLEKLDSTERAALEESGTAIRFVPFLPGYSTTALIGKIAAAAAARAL